MVQKGDSLWSIANANNTTVDELANLNDLANNTIYVGQVLQIPSSGDGNQNIPSTDTVYVVQRGDTLYSIAQKYNTTVGAIRSKNNLTSDTLSVGQILTIPGDIESTGEEDVTEDTTTTYVVKRGDSLYTIASTYGVTVDELKNANGIVGDIITVGQVLTIPSGNSNTSNLYVVQRGDSLWSIANRFGVSVNALRMINNLTSDVLSIGQTLIIP
ncbi:MAG: LysM peptidoglycan-binding domain-containing protein [Bacilli bacterium]|nr:LysM peptidoglycan-binding domain-containing protein [Bacilli bacterium]